MSRYAKALAAFLTALAAWGSTAYADGRLEAGESFGLALALAAGLTVYAVPNRPPRGKARRPDVSETSASDGG